LLAALMALALATIAVRVEASTAYGDLNNFDVFNDTGTDCHGFEIELDDVRSTDITYTYDWNHYGAPVISEDRSDPQHPKVFVRYAAKYSGGNYSAFTAVPASPPAPTDGHMCTNPAVNIGCEHFGVGYYGTPSLVKYHWLVADPFVSGQLIQGPPVNVATPSWTYYAPAPAQPVAQVQAVILAPPPPPVPIYEFGDATWVKSIVTTSHNNQRVELKDLVTDDPDDPNGKDWRNGEPDEVEVEWHLLQTEFSKPDGVNNELAGGLEDLPHGDEVVTRRYEFYKYSGPHDPESNEAKCDNYPQIADAGDPRYKAECDPAQVAVLGDYIGAQMAGFNVEAELGLIDHLQDGDLYSEYTPRTVVVGGNTPYTTQVTNGALPPDMNLDSATGVLSGFPTAAGVYSFTITARDADDVQVSRPFTMMVSGDPVDLCAGVVCGASDGCHEVGVCDPSTGWCTEPPAADGTACDDGDACTLVDTCQAGVCSGGQAVTCPASGACHDAGICDRTTGLCSDPVSADGTACNDGNGCTLTDECQAGVCIGRGQNPSCVTTTLSLRYRAARAGRIGRSMRHRIGVRNSGPVATTATASLRCSGLAFTVATAPSNCQAAGDTLTCDFGMVAPRSFRAAAIELTATNAGVLTCTATSNSPEALSQTITKTTTVRLPR